MMISEKINTKIIYSTIIELQKTKIDKKDIEKIILIEVPTEIYPELRKIFIFIFEMSGFKEIKLMKKLILKKLYNMRKVSIKIFFNSDFKNLVSLFHLQKYL